MKNKITEIVYKIYHNIITPASDSELLRTCLNALEDVKKLNKQLTQEGKHGYTLMEIELSNAIKLALRL